MTDYITDETVTYADIAKKYGVDDTTVGLKAAEEGWVELRQETQVEVRKKLIEKSTDALAQFQVKKLEHGNRMIAIGMTGLEENKPRSARVAKEVVETGYKLATEAVGLDKPGISLSIGIMTVNQFAEEMSKREQEEHERPAAPAVVEPDATASG